MTEELHIYTIVVDDRHSDLEIETFINKDAAIDRAQKLANEYCRFPEDYEEINTEKWNNGVIFRADYSCESDSITVYDTSIKMEHKK